jgi:hypothetical protein
MCQIAQFSLKARLALAKWVLICQAPPERRPTRFKLDL